MAFLRTLLRPTCPACGKGRLFSGFLTIATICETCGISLREHEKGDGPAFFGIVIVGFVVTTLAGLVEYGYEPPYWVHAVLWGPLIIVLSLLCLRYFKAVLIQWQWRHRREDFMQEGK